MAEGTWAFAGRIAVGNTQTGGAPRMLEEVTGRWSLFLDGQDRMV